MARASVRHGEVEAMVRWVFFISYPNISHKIVP